MDDIHLLTEMVWIFRFNSKYMKIRMWINDVEIDLPEENAIQLDYPTEPSKLYWCGKPISMLDEEELKEFKKYKDWIKYNL